MSLEAYLIDVGIRASDFGHQITEQERKLLKENVEYFKQTFEDGLSAYKALLFFEDYLNSKTMQKFRNKPVEIEAIQYTGKNDFEISKWSNNLVYPSPVLEPSEGNLSGSYLQVKTLEGVITATPGDWIIKGIKGEFYPCKPDIFEQTYDKVD